MDYSSIHENENLTGPSPWASSPQAGRTSFGEPRADAPSPTPGPRTSTDASNADLSISEEPLPPPATAIESDHREQAPQQALEQASIPYRPQEQEVQPQQQSQHQSQQRYHNRPPSRQHPQYKLQPKLTGLERPGRKDPILRFDVYTNLPGFRTTQFRDVRRTHSEFQKLADHLISANPEAMVPAVPASSTPAGVGTDEDETRVKAAMQRWLSIVFGNEILMRDDEIVRFVEGDPGYSPVMRRSQPATGVRRKVIKQFAPPPDDTPELQDARPVVKSFYLGSMDASQKMDRVVKARRGLGLAEAEFGAKLASMAEPEGHPGLKNAYRKLGRTVQTTGDLHAVQGTSEATVLGEPLNYFSNDAFIVKETLTNRHILLRDLLAAQATTRTKLSATERLRASTSVRRDKVDEAIASLEEARAHETHLGNKTQRVTHYLLKERRRWSARTAEDLRAAIREFAVRQIEAERRQLATLEAVRPDIRAVDASGGLSRLGREATPAARRSAIQSSQGPKGDAWSGVARRPDAMNRSMSGAYSIPTPGAEDDNSNPVQGDGPTQGRKRATSGNSSILDAVNEDDDDRVDARNAASRLAASTF
ncbi:hypothetical protein FH972_023724 [Carpinus fangiana]|uniref:Vacuolar protein sorting-associated protein 17 n=1 Tax=Carpinus fangiana TaxID=176857 RepID=A0A5N6KWI2_9ROSI|nr:hypothetical protein FH972_023724 [Carpinus fangiana]